MTLPALVVAWLGGSCLQSLLRVPPWMLWLSLPLPAAIAALCSREWRFRLSASCALFLLLGALRYNAAVPAFDEGHLAFYNDHGTATITGVVIEALDVRGRYVNLKVSARCLEIDGEEYEAQGLTLVRTGRHPSLQLR